MPFQKGHKLATGRKTLSEELIKRATELKKEEIAKELHNSELLDMKESGYSHEQMKDFVMPVIVKGMIDKSETTVILPKPLLGGQSNGSNNNSDKETTETESGNESD